MDPRLKKARLRLLEDFEHYAAKALKIRTKDGTISPLVLNGPQKRLVETIDAQLKATGKVRIITLKARQQGLSTAIGAWLYWYVSQHSAQKALVVTHHADSSRSLFDLTKRYHENVPEFLRPTTKYASRRELKFSTLDSGYMVATAGGDGIARGETLTHAHLSELAFWQKSSARENLNGLLQAIPNTPGSAIFIESTANGVSGPFWDIWQGAVRGENDFLPLFIAWFETPEYREKVPEGFERTPTEQDLVNTYGIDDEQLMFRRLKIAATSLELWTQEYPSNADEAFLTSGAPVFDTPLLAARSHELPNVLELREMVGDVMEENLRGRLKVYHKHEPGETYYIGADVAAGIRGKDYSVAQILDSKKRQVAVWRGHVYPDDFAHILHALGTYYNMAQVIVESNNHGILTCTVLGKYLAYPYFHTETVYNRLDDEDTVKLGFSTTSKSKPLIIDQLRSDHRAGELELNDRDTVSEMMTFIVTDTGTMEAEDGCFDDTVMALALSNHIHAGVFTPVVSTDDFYVRSI